MKEYFKKMIDSFDFEYREGQIEMASIIERHLNEYEPCIIEAGTGIGKTLAYLMPLVLYAKEHRTRIVISTNTINLQEQLVEKDLPLLEKILGQEIKYMLVKGRSNYACHVRFMKNNKNEKLAKWFENTKTGDKAEIDFYLNADEWNLVKSDKDYCSVKKCNCFFYKARKELQDQEILIVNHSLLFSNFKYDKILPKFNILLIDEAHNLENSARKYFEYSINSSEVSAVLGMLYNRKNKVGAYLSMLGKIAEYVSSTSYIVFEENRDEVLSLFNLIYDNFIKQSSEISKIMVEKNIEKIRRKYIENRLEKYIEYNKEVINNFKKLSKIIKVLKENIEAYNLPEDIYQDFFALYDKLKENIDTLKTIEKNSQDEYVNWFKFNLNDLSIDIMSTPYIIADKLEKELLKDNKNVILTSATLRVDNKFEYIKSRLGISNFEEYVIKSPFDYDRNMKILLSKNSPDVNTAEFIDYTASFINNYAKEKNGNCFVLFTSYKFMSQVYNKLELEDFIILKQGDMSRTNLIETFKSNDKSILLGTDSFWEGVDVKGDKLKSIIIPKLPFQVPDDPIVEAIIENIQKQGDIPFIKYQLPLMTVKLCQGVGRLIRSKKDEGEIVILDSRIVKKSYGKSILNSFPSKNILKF
ncbi:ATP-dependent DNA helicase [Caviibacter abscessus]|uniref:ATP-dependent DNA helicase n=1 Tax=Caviibacter abscessus TaxID=1766719 RepID=UPI000834CF6A|nr:helicase C-terminal domain-containing protein [Caviibacter abscessus]